MTRRTTPLLVAIILVLAAAATLFWVARRGRTAMPAFTKTAGQNILLVTIDTLRGDALGAYGGQAATPHLDRLARDGVRFTSAHAHAVVTLPSHTSILTGRYPFEHGVRDNAGYRLDPAIATVATMTKQRGLTTGAFVGAFPLDRRFGLNQGFDVYDDVGGRGIEEADFAFAERRAEEVVTAARAWIAQQRGPWFAWVHVFDPHAGYSPPAPFDNQYAANPYAGEVAYVDHAIGPLLELARAASRPTSVIVTSDHGEGLGDHGETTHGTFAYESTLRVPLIVSQIGVQIDTSSRGATVDTPVRHVDILPTIADLLGFEVAGLPGRSLLLAGLQAGLTAGEADRDESSYFEAMTPMLTRGWAPLRGIILDRRKYVDLPIEELYDLRTDPREERNLSATPGEALPALTARLRAMNAALPGEQRAEPSEARARLESLGYVARSAPRKARFTAEDDPKRLIELDRLMLNGIDLFQRGRTAQAIEAYQQVIARRPDMGLAYRRLAFIQWESGVPAAAISTLRDALARAGREVDLEIRLGAYLSETGALPEATNLLERVARAEPANADALNALGIAYARAGKSADALRVFDQVLAANPRDVHALENTATVQLGRGELAAAATAFNAALAIEPRSSRAEAGLGIVASRAGRRDEAITRWRSAVDLDPRNFDALFNLATELVNAKRPDEARPYLERFVRTAPRAFYGRDVDRLAGLLVKR